MSKCRAIFVQNFCLFFEIFGINSTLIRGNSDRINFVLIRSDFRS